MSFIELIRNTDKKNRSPGSLALANTDKFTYWHKATDLNLSSDELTVAFPIKRVILVKYNWS